MESLKGWVKPEMLNALDVVGVTWLMSQFNIALKVGKEPLVRQTGMMGIRARRCVSTVGRM